MTATRTAVRRPAPSPRLRRYPGIDRVAAELVALVDRERVTPRVRRLAARLAEEGGLRRNGLGHVDLRDRRGFAGALLRAVRRRVNYTNDPEKTELVSSPFSTLREGIGDCEDMVVLGGALLSSHGVPVRIVLVGYGPEGYDHTYLEVDAGDGWTAWDATLEGPSVRFGTRAPGERRRRAYRVARAAQFGLAGVPDDLVPIRPGSGAAPTVVDGRTLSATTTRTIKRAAPSPATVEAEARKAALAALGSGRGSYTANGRTYALPTGLDQDTSEGLRLVIEGTPRTIGGARYEWSAGRLWTNGSPNGPALLAPEPTNQAPVVVGTPPGDGGVMNCLVPPCPQPGVPWAPAPEPAPAPLQPTDPPNGGPSTGDATGASERGASDEAAPVTLFGVPLPVALSVGGLGLYLLTRQNPK